MFIISKSRKLCQQHAHLSRQNLPTLNYASSRRRISTTGRRYDYRNNNNNNNLKASRGKVDTWRVINILAKAFATAVGWCRSVCIVICLTEALGMSPYVGAAATRGEGTSCWATSKRSPAFRSSLVTVGRRKIRRMRRSSSRRRRGRSKRASSKRTERKTMRPLGFR